MLMELWNNETNEKLGTYNIWFSPETFLISTHIDGISIEDANIILQNQLEPIADYDEERQILSSIHLEHNHFLFGRMDEVVILRALLKYFTKEGSPYALYPARQELLTFVSYDEKYDQMYLLNPRGK